MACPSGGVSEDDELRRKNGGSSRTLLSNDYPVKQAMHLLSAKEALLSCALVLSNHFPASLLSPELCWLEYSFGEILDGGFALSLAGALAESSEEGCRGWRNDADLLGSPVGGLCRRDTDSCAGRRRGWGIICCGGIVPGGSGMVVIKLRWLTC
jgi:hypothetical protein